MNLDKVVQHGKRADTIVKNMLLHSREGSGEHRLIDINALVEESLNLAYHGARAEKQGFNITLERSLDPNAGEADVFPQDITRVLLNLISNGFYAATRRTAEGNGNDYEPTLAAVTKSLGDRVEIRIRDNGTGIPPEVKEKMFNPFFTTKPAGEGTGLGLSISHDIIVKQHGGSLEIDTQPGKFTEFRIILPRRLCSLPNLEDERDPPSPCPLMAHRTVPYPRPTYWIASVKVGSFSLPRGPKNVFDLCFGDLLKPRIVISKEKGQTRSLPGPLFLIRTLTPRIDHAMSALAQSGHGLVHCKCPLSGVKRTSRRHGGRVCF